MTMREIHQEALQSATTPYHEFIGRYRKVSKTVYGFVEGKDDPGFYRGFVDTLLPESWEIDMRSVGNRDRVISLFREFNWTRFSSERIVFFIDRDLVDFTSQDLPSEKNIYVSDGYSIENSIVNRSTCSRVLTELCNLSGLADKEMSYLLDMFEEQLAAFCQAMIPIMSWIILSRRSGQKPCLNNIEMKHLFDVVKGKVNRVSSPRRHADCFEYMQKQCDVPSPSDDVCSVSMEMGTDSRLKKNIRGKYLLWFMVEFVLSVSQNIQDFSTLEKPPKMHVALGHGNAMAHIAPRARVPRSLKAFLMQTCVKFATEANAA